MALLSHIHVIPKAKAIVSRCDIIPGQSWREASAKAAQEIGVTVLPLGVREPDDFNDAFTAMTREPPDAILMLTDSLILPNRKRVFEFAAERRLVDRVEEERAVSRSRRISLGGRSK
jgi:putative ABC transport system substrate-binding protein